MTPKEEANISYAHYSLSDARVASTVTRSDCGARCVIDEALFTPVAGLTASTGTILEENP